MFFVEAILIDRAEDLQQEQPAIAAEHIFKKFRARFPHVNRPLSNLVPLSDLVVLENPATAVEDGVPGLLLDGQDTSD